MKFLLEFVSCCGAGVAASDRDEGDSAAHPPLEEETRSLVPLARRCKRRLRVRMGPSGSVPPEWKPSLGAISEDTVVAEKKAEANRSQGSDRAAKRKAVGSKARIHVRTHSDDFGRSSYSQVIPAFSPAPFMF